MNTLHITGKHIVNGWYIGPDVSDYDGNIEIAANIGTVVFGSGIATKGHLHAATGLGIEAGMGIKPGLGIEAGTSIRCKWLFVALRIFAGTTGYRLPTAAEQEIVGEIRGGTVAFGTVVKRGIEP